MRKRIVFKDQARSDLRAIDRIKALQILQALDRLSLTGDGDVKRLQDVEPPEFRLRVGNYRLRFTTRQIPFLFSRSTTEVKLIASD